MHIFPSAENSHLLRLLMPPHAITPMGERFTYINILILTGIFLGIMNITILLQRNLMLSMLDTCPAWNGAREVQN